MKRRVKIALMIPVLLFFLFSTLVFIVFNSSYWKAPMLNLVNSRVLKKFDLQISVDGLEGNILRNLEFVNLKLQTTSDNTLIHAENLHISYRLHTFFSSQPEITGIEIDGGSIAFPSAIDSLTEKFKKEEKESETAPKATLREPKTWATDFGITEFTYYHAGNPLTVNMLFGDLLIRKDSLAINFDTARVFINDRFNTVTLSSTKLINSSKRFSIRDIKIFNYETKITGELNFPKDSVNHINFTVENIKPQYYLPDQIEEFSEEDFLNIDGKINFADRTEFIGNFHGTLRSNEISRGLFSAHLAEGLFDLEEFRFTAGQEQMKIDFNTISGENYTGNIKVSDLDLQKWKLINTPTKMTGATNFSVKGPLGTPEKITANIDFFDTDVEPLDINKIRGSIVYENNRLDILDTILCKLDNNIFRITGTTDFDRDQIDLICEVDAPKISIFAPLAKSPELKGEIFGKISVRGNLKNPNLNGQLSANKIGIPEIYFEQSKLNVALVNLAKNRSGSLVMNAKNGRSKFIDVPFPLLNLDMSFNNDTTTINSLDISGEEFKLDLKGKIISLETFIVDELAGTLKSTEFHTLDPIIFTLQDNKIGFQEINLSVNGSDIELEGEVEHNQLKYAHANVNDFDLSAMNDFIPEKHHLKGRLSGNFDYNINAEKQEIDIDITGKKISYRDDYFSQLNCDLSLINNKIIVTEISLADSALGELTAAGDFSCNFPAREGEKFIDSTNTVNMHLDFNNFDLSILNTYVLYNTKLAGSLLGDFTFTNTIHKPDIAASFFILQPVFDKITAKSLRINADIKNSTAKINNIYLVDEAGSYYGQGILPLEIGLLKGIMTLDQTRELNLDLYSEMSSIPPLPAYIEDIQSLEGNMSMTLKIRGKSNEPVAKGNFTISEGKIDLTSLENPIYDLNGSAELEDNVLKIEDFKGQMKSESMIKIKSGFANMIRRIFTKNLINPNKPNITIAGTVDLNTLPTPKINLTLIGEDAYIRTPLGEQEGVADIDISINGQDTVNVDGNILMKNFVVRNELTASGETYVEPTEGDIYTEINLHLISPGNFYIRNSKLDCELEGEGWLFKSGNEDFKISGDFNILNGSLYYLNWELKDLQGNILFRPQELNPTLDLQAKLDLSGISKQTENPATGAQTTEDELVTVYLTGDFEKPNLQFESTQYSQSDILRILTYTYEGEEANLKENVYDYAGAFFQRQLERQISKISGLDEFQLKTEGNIFEGLDTQISIMMGRRITNNLYVTYEKDFDKLNPKSSYGLRYRIDRKKSISGQIDNNGLFQIKYRFRHHY